MDERSELPPALLAAVVDDSLNMFVGYYGGLRPGHSPAAEMRCEIFGIIGAVAEVVPSLTDAMMRQVHRMLLIAAVSGMRPDAIRACKGGTGNLGMALSDPFLGLAVTAADFVDYRTAIRRLASRFDGEDLVAMARAVQQNYALPEDE
jgi:hypothetical protein